MRGSSRDLQFDSASPASEEASAFVPSAEFQMAVTMTTRLIL